MKNQSTTSPRDHSLKSVKGLADFDLLPDSGNVRVAVVEVLFSCSKRNIWRLVKTGDFPAPKKLSARVTAWNVGELRRALADRGVA